MNSQISLVRTQNRAESVRKAINLLQSNPVQGKAIVLKPNFNSADATPGSTHNNTLRALVLTLQEMGASRITVAERSGPGERHFRRQKNQGHSAGRLVHAPGRTGLFTSSIFRLLSAN